MSPSVVDLPLSVSSLLQIIRDAEHLATRYGSTTAACARLDELERGNVEMQTQLASLQKELSMSTGVNSQSDRHSSGRSPEHRPQSFPPLHHHLNYSHHNHLPSLDVDALVAFLCRHCMLQGDPDLLGAVLDDFVRLLADPSSETHIPPRAVVISVEEAAHSIKKPHYYAQHHPNRPPPSLRSRFQWNPPPSPPSRYRDHPSNRSPRPRRPDQFRGPPSPIRPLLPHLRPDESAAATLSSMSSNPRPSSAPVVRNGRSSPPVKQEEEERGISKRKRTSSPPEVEIVIKQNLDLPHDKRNIVELKQSSMLLTLPNLEAFNKQAPWDQMYQQRATYSHILNYAGMEERARKWFAGTLRVQFVWRREFWERLHWLPMSEAVCSGPQWERYRQQRKRRANKAIAAWRKVYGDSIELIRLGLLPQDVWCDVALWYMPATPLYWLPTSSHLENELKEIDEKQPVRCYHVLKGIKESHPFYQDKTLVQTYPKQYQLPSIKDIAVPTEEKETRVNITPED